MNSDRKVVVTGMGVVSPIGIGNDAFFEALLAGRSGVENRGDFADTDLPMRLAARVTDFEAKQFVKPRKALKIMCEPIKFGCAAASMAAEQAGLTNQITDTPPEGGFHVSPDRVGTVFGTETFFADPSEVARVFRSCIVNQDYQHDRWGEFAMREIQPLWMLKYLPNMAASHISIGVNARGPSNSICQGAASGLLAVIEAASLVTRGVADVVIAGGTGSQMALTAMLYRGTELLSKSQGNPETASRPFDKNRDGMVVGEGAGVVVLESLDHATARGATPLAEFVGASRLFSSPAAVDRADGIESSLRIAIKDAGLSPDQIGLVNASASGEILSDAFEAQAIEKVFGQVPVTAHKSNFGNLGPGTSVVELIGGLMALQQKKIPQTINYETADPQCPVNIVRETRTLDQQSVIKTSYSATGQIATVVFKELS